MCFRCCVCTDGPHVSVSGNGQRLPAGPAVTLQPHNPAVHEQGAEGPVSGPAAAQTNPPLYGKEKLSQQN